MISRKIFFVKAKLSLDNVKQARKALFKAITIRERETRIQSELNFIETDILRSGVGSS